MRPVPIAAESRWTAALASPYSCRQFFGKPLSAPHKRSYILTGGCRKGPPLWKDRRGHAATGPDRGLGGFDEFGKIYRAGARLRSVGAELGLARRPPAIHARTSFEGSTRGRPGP